MWYVRRADDWPEEPYRVEWLEHHVRVAEIERASFERGEVAEALTALWRRAPVVSPRPEGVAQATDHIAPLFVHRARPAQ